MNILQKLNIELVTIIKSYIPYQKLVFTNRENYYLYHNFLKPSIINYENYIRHTIRCDNEFVFERIIIENFDKWEKINKYSYKNMIFKNYLYFTIYYCIENESSNCRIIIIKYLKTRGFDKNLYKKNIIKYITWKN
jgi:hypothetical protein